MPAIVPIPKCDVSVRLATPADIPFIDSLQKRYNEQLGFMRTSWLEERISKREVLVAEDEACTRVGHVICTDKYMMREDVGIVLQLCVSPEKQRGFIGMTLLKAAFERSSYGVRLFCCWCAQDIEANRFWESVGFVPLAYRAGSEKKGRVHIFWQKRIREGDAGANATPWWFPSETKGGAMGAPRLVFPIPNDRHWSDEMPVILPEAQETQKKLPGPRKAKAPVPVVPKRPMISRAMTLRVEAPKPPEAQKPKEKKPRERKKNDPKLVAAARELRDRWLEHVNGAAGAGEMMLEAVGKYDVARALPDAPAARQRHFSATAMLTAA